MTKRKYRIVPGEVTGFFHAEFSENDGKTWDVGEYSSEYGCENWIKSNMLYRDAEEKHRALRNLGAREVPPFKYF